MSSFLEIKKAIDDTATAFEEFKKTNDQRIEALKTGNESKAAELDKKLERIDADIKAAVLKKDEAMRELEFMRERIEELEAKGLNPGKTGGSKAANEYKDAFIGWMRSRGQSVEHERKMLDIVRRNEQQQEQKDITIGSTAGGGFGVPEEISVEIEKMERKLSPVRSLVKVGKAGSSDYKELVSINGATSGWVGESTNRPGTGTPTLREIVPTFGELYAYPQVSEWSLDDIFFDVEGWLTDSVSEEFASAEGDAVIRGNAANKPTGMLNSAPTAVTDEAGTRAAAVYEFVPNIDANFKLLPDQIISLQYKLNAKYRAEAAWVMNSNSAGECRKMKDNNGQYLWQPSLIAGEPDMLLGKQIAIWEQMDNPGANAYPIAFGNFRRGYVLADRVGLRITRDNVTNIGFVKFYVRRREGGIVLNNNAIKFLKTTAT